MHSSYSICDDQHLYPSCLHTYHIVNLCSQTSFQPPLHRPLEREHDAEDRGGEGQGRRGAEGEAARGDRGEEEEEGAGAMDGGDNAVYSAPGKYCINTIRVSGLLPVVR